MYPNKPGFFIYIDAIVEKLILINNVAYVAGNDFSFEMRKMIIIFCMYE